MAEVVIINFHGAPVTFSRDTDHYAEPISMWMNGRPYTWTQLVRRCGFPMGSVENDWNVRGIELVE